MPVGPIHRLKRRQVHLADRVEHRPHQVSLRHPITNRRRHLKHLVTVKPDEPRAHPAGSRPDRTTPFPDSLRRKRHYPPGCDWMPRVHTSFDASAVAFERDDRPEAQSLVLAEHPDGSGRWLDVQRPMQVGEQDVALA